jgi:hypothetical protein
MTVKSMKELHLFALEAAGRWAAGLDVIGYAKASVGFHASGTNIWSHSFACA